MLPKNSVDAYAFWIVIMIFAIIIGNLFYEAFFTNWKERFYFEAECPAPCCEEEEA
tara:strand:+ start:6978 stop:7145 length:168 start_codon:yes stop_codon:yes gene_type:complete